MYSTSIFIVLLFSFSFFYLYHAQIFCIHVVGVARSPHNLLKILNQVVRSKLISFQIWNCMYVTNINYIRARTRSVCNILCCSINSNTSNQIHFIDKIVLIIFVTLFSVNGINLHNMGE